MDQFHVTVKEDGKTRLWNGKMHLRKSPGEEELIPPKDLSEKIPSWFHKRIVVTITKENEFCLQIPPFSLDTTGRNHDIKILFEEDNHITINRFLSRVLRAISDYLPRQEADYDDI